MRNEITSNDDLIDSRDVIARIEELEADLEGFEDKSGCEYDDLQSELDNLKALASEAEDYAPDWQYGATLIRESYFTEYCRDLVQDIGDLPNGIPHYIEIDWQATARNIRVDYTEVTFDGVTYLVR